MDKQTLYELHNILDELTIGNVEIAREKLIEILIRLNSM